MKIDNSIVNQYIDGEPSFVYSKHWVYSEIVPGQHLFTEPDVTRAIEVKGYRDQIAGVCTNFTLRNCNIVFEVFDNVSSIIENANILFTVGLPEMYDAMVREHNGEAYVIIDLINFSNYIDSGNELSDLASNFLSHELIHVLINAKYPQEDFDYIGYLNFISFHEGFAHLFSYRENIMQYQPDDTYKERFNTAKNKLITALKETDPELCQRYSFEANGGKYWDKFGSISSMLYLMKHLDSLKSIYERGWRGFTNEIISYDWD